MSRSELVRLSGVSKQQLSRLETGLIRLRLDHLKPFAGPLGYTPEQILLWGRYPGTTGSQMTQAAHPARGRSQPPARCQNSTCAPAKVEAFQLTNCERMDVTPTRSRARGGYFLQVSCTSSCIPRRSQLLVVDTAGDSMAPTIASGERAIIDTGHKTPTPDGLYAIRDTFNSIIVKRLQVLRSARPPRVKIISDNNSHPSEEAPLGELEIVGKVLCCLKLF